jgi:L-alanine-DL-glutamate epimerase-like enolase superfamily enzyme
MATAHWAGTVRNFLASETVVGRGDWTDDVGRLVQDGFIRLTDRPGLGPELNPDFVKAHLAPGESYCG